MKQPGTSGSSSHVLKVSGPAAKGCNKGPQDNRLIVDAGHDLWRELEDGNGMDATTMRAIARQQQPAKKAAKARHSAAEIIRRIYPGEPLKPRESAIPPQPDNSPIGASYDDLPDEFVARNHTALHAMAGRLVREMISEPQLRPQSEP